MSLRAFLATCAALLLATSIASATVPTLSPDELVAGQKAVVRTVFTGQKVEEFEAEIVGVLKGGRVSGDLILARATSDRVLRTGIAQGMSGSPVYVDGKLVGALSSGWSFSREPLFGVTPIAEMLTVLDQPRPADDGSGSVGPTGLEPPPAARSAYRGLRWTDEPDASATRTAAPASGDAAAAPTPLPIPVSCVGLEPAALPLAHTLLAPLGLVAVPGGRTGVSAAARPDLQPGSAVAVDLLRGDLQMAAIGTVTWRDGDRVLIFGHPLFQSGAVKLPLSSADITTIVSSQMISFKLGSSGVPVGVATQDRRAAVGGIMGAPPRLMPLAVRLEGPASPARTYHFESIEDRALAPQIVALAGVNSLLESGGTGAGQTVRWTLTAYRRGASPLVVSDVATGGSMLADLMSGISQPLGYLYNNPFAPLKLDSVAVRMSVEPGQDSWTLREMQLLDAAVRPGGRLHARCTLERWRGERRTVDLSLEVPEEFPPGRYVLWAGGGDELDRYEAQRLPGRFRPASLEEAWTRLGSLRRSDRLYVALIARAPEVTRLGRDYPELPTSALALLSSGLSAEDVLRRGTLAVLDEQQKVLGGRVGGEVQIEFTVDPNAP
jgi:SpoIVB peptidase S55